jgi:hypothetical protein
VSVEKGDRAAAKERKRRLIYHIPYIKLPNLRLGKYRI